MFYVIAAELGKVYDKNVLANPICKTIAWDADNTTLISAWTRGRTGFPYIDALMRQMRATGWMHHLGRHAVSCFFTRGQLYQNWVHGRDVFDRFLVDSDWCVNTGNWLWLAGVAPFSMPFFRVYSPKPVDGKPTALNFGKGNDGNSFIRFWVPEVSAVPDKFLTAPWEAGSGHYVKPVVDPKGSQANLDKFKASLYGLKASGGGAAKRPAGGGEKPAKVAKKK